MKLDDKKKSVNFRDETWIPKYSGDWRSRPDEAQGSPSGTSIITNPQAFSLDDYEQHLIKSGAKLQDIMFIRLLRNRGNHALEK